MKNKYQGQFLASNQTDKIFKEKEQLFFQIKKQCSNSVDYLQSIGIQAKEGTEVLLNNQSFKIGTYGFLQFNNVKITSIKFNHDTDSTVKIDYIIHEKNGIGE